MESIHSAEVDVDGVAMDLRKKDALFYVIKGICSTVQLIFLIYEML
jgi:hypothetical protein